MNTNKITDLHIQISKEDLKILDLLLKANEYSNIVFYCENDEEHFIFTEVKLGNYFCIDKFYFSFNAYCLFYFSK
ncbi:hypothetical protein ACFBB3_001708 [Campylobacter coli]|nr:hypothetical protein [Campylobacter coli]